MKKFKIKLIDVGRDNHNSEEKKQFKSLKEAAYYAYKKADKFLLSSNTSLEGEAGKYTVYAGFQPVGIVEIEEII